MSSSLDSRRHMTVHNLARTIMQEFDVTLGGQFYFDELANFIDGFADTIAGQQATAAADSTVTPAAITPPIPVEPGDVRRPFAS